MSKRVILIMIALRSKSAVSVQEILTTYGCLIKTRLGIHENEGAKCTETGMVIIELVNGQDEKATELVAELEALEEVSVKDVELSL